MRYPNTRYGHHGEFVFWMQGHSVKVIAKRLKCSERSVTATGIPTEQAESHATALAEAMNNEVVKNLI